MKKAFLPLIFLALCSLVKSQNCREPVSSIIFRQEYNRLSAIQHDQPRLARANDFVKSNCLLADQVKKIATLFNDDVTRLDFVENAYPSIFDKDNFYDVYDAFAYFSSVMRLHDYIANFDKTGRRQVRTAPNPESEFNFPKYNYPSYRSYKEQTRCSEPLDNETFYRLLRNIVNQPDDETRTTMAIQLAENNCLSVEQIMKMGSLIGKEPQRLDYLKRIYKYSYDADDFHYSDQLLTDQTYREDLNNYLQAQHGHEHEHEHEDEHEHKNPRKVVGHEHHPVPVCHVSNAELSDIIASIKKQSFDNTQLTMAKQIVRAKQCFTAMQIKQIVDIFSFENSKLEMAKFCYPYCVDKSNYYKIDNSFSFSSSVTELNQFISAQH